MNNRHYRQEQFLDVIDRDQAERLFLAAIDCRPRGVERAPLEAGLGRVLAADQPAPIDVPNFDRSNVDGYAVMASTTAGAQEDAPVHLRMMDCVIEPGGIAAETLVPGSGWAIATGAAVPRGADAVVMVEHTDVVDDELLVYRPASPGNGLSFAATDISQGELVLRQGELLTSRETGLLAALGVNEIPVYRQPIVAVISTGNELLAPGETAQPGQVFDSNSRILADAVYECGGVALPLGIVRDDEDQLRKSIQRALDQADVVLLSGGTSKGAGDLCYRVVREMTSPGIIAHGVALKPGKPICLAAHSDKPVVILPGFPTSAVFTFHEFVAPVIRQMAGLPTVSQTTVSARMPFRLNSEIGRTEYALVGLVPEQTAGVPGQMIAFPMGKGSGSVTTFSRADGFITIQRNEEIIEAGQQVTVQLLSQRLQASDLVVIGSHCPGLDRLLSLIQSQGYQTKFLAVGSSAGLQAARQGYCDLAGIHLLDETSGEYNVPFVTDEVVLIPGYSRWQGIVHRANDERFVGKSADEILNDVVKANDLRMVNRNSGSGTRILLDRRLGESRPPGYPAQVTNHNAVAACISQGRADWGLAIETVVGGYGLAFAPLADERFDFVTPKSRTDRPAVKAFRQLLQDADVRAELLSLGFAFAT